MKILIITKSVIFTIVVVSITYFLLLKNDTITTAQHIHNTESTILVPMSIYYKFKFSDFNQLYILLFLPSGYPQFQVSIKLIGNPINITNIVIRAKGRVNLYQKLTGIFSS